MTPEKTPRLPGYKQYTFICDKCGRKTIVESDFLTDSQAKSVHKCVKEKSKK